MSGKTTIPAAVVLAGGEGEALRWH